MGYLVQLPRVGNELENERGRNWNSLGARHIKRKTQEKYSVGEAKLMLRV